MKRLPVRYERAEEEEKDYLKLTGISPTLLVAKERDMGCGRFVLDPDSVHYISRLHQAVQIADYISARTIHEVIDATGNVGGDTIQLARRLDAVYSVELDHLVAYCLQRNVEAAGVKDKVSVRVGDCFEVVPSLLVETGCRSVYVDPPWGGADYKDKKAVRLYFGTRTMADFLETIRRSAEGVVVFAKVPVNYDETQFGPFAVLDKHFVMSRRGTPCMVLLVFRPEVGLFLVP